MLNDRERREIEERMTECGAARGALTDALKVLARYDISAILGTPTAVMPAWLAQKYPGALRTKADGTQIVWGGRKHNCYSSIEYRRLSRQITRAMQFVAASKLRRAQESTLAARPYSDLIDEILADLATVLGGEAAFGGEWKIAARTATPPTTTRTGPRRTGFFFAAAAMAAACFAASAIRWPVVSVGDSASMAGEGCVG